MANQFDPFAPTPTPATPSSPFDAFAPDSWQQSASNVWKNASASLQRSVNNNSRSSVTTNAAADPKKRIVPYEGPIGTLSSQWDGHLFVANAAMGNNAAMWKNNGNLQSYLILSTNEACIPMGGVEGVLKWNKAKGAELNEVNVSSLSLVDDEAGHAATVGVAAGANLDYGAAKKTPGGGLNFLKSGLKKAQGAIERSVTTIAIKADGGKNRDWVCISLVYKMQLNSMEGNTAMLHAVGSSSQVMNSTQEVCLSKTEWVQLPTVENHEGLLFHIPLTVPDLTFLPTDNGGARLTIRMSIRSGALLNIVKREYMIGECTVQYSNIVQMTTCASGMMYSNTVNLPVTSGMLSEVSGTLPAVFKVTATQRIKFAPPCSLGWSLTDPISSPEMLIMFTLPLDQAYVFEIMNAGVNNTHHSSGVLIANERAVESTLTLPIAAAVSRLMACAAAESAKIAELAAKRAYKRESIRCFAIPDDESKAEAVVEAALNEGCADVEIGVVALMLENGAVGPPVSGMMLFQRCDSIFEETLVNSFSLPLMDKISGEAMMKVPTPTREAVVKRFCPRLYTGNMELDGGDALLPGVLGTSQHGYVGTIRLSVSVSLGLNADAALGVAGGVTSIEGVVPLEPYLNPNTQRSDKIPVLAPAIDANTGKVIGKFLFLLRVKTLPSPSRALDTVPSSMNGLISTVGLDTLTENIGLSYQLDNGAASPEAASGVRQRQVATMGAFLTSGYLKYQAEQRARDASVLSDRFDKYYNSVVSEVSSVSSDVKLEDESDVPLFKRRTPRPFRPSNSRHDALLAGIGFNVHVQELTLHMLQDGQEGISASICASVTHGAPADHARGFGVFGNDDSESTSNVARGGLRRLETARLEYAKEVDDNITGLITAVGEYFNMRAHTAAARQQAGVKNSRHVPTNIQGCNYYRKSMIESMEKLHSLTWEVSIRRVNCFSQALGIAVTSYLVSLSDGGPAWKFANIWAQHGYLVTFEGLLSAVGKELGMIEDASTAIEMLRMVSVVLLPADNASSNNAQDHRIPVVHSPFVRSVNLQKEATSKYGTETQYRLEISLDPSYFQNRVPAPLRGTQIRFVPVLFQMGVDIRQWGANAGRSVTTQIKDRTKAAPGVDDCCADVEVNNEPVCGLIDDGDDDDEGGVADTEILVILNLEGFRKLNVYAHTINPTPFTPSSMSTLSLEQMQALPAHPLLSILSDTIRASAGKMEHGVLDHAATACQRFGGGSTVFCKSGKDRTAMQVTFKQAQFLQRFMDKKDASPPEDAQLPFDEVFANSTLMRIHGTRVPICEKNAGESKYAFNPLQAKFMPDALKPPPIALAGFLKKPET
ncbi:hypothetical protein ACHAXN_009042 [Cyclotella atomus]